MVMPPRAGIWAQPLQRQPVPQVALQVSAEVLPEPVSEYPLPSAECPAGMQAILLV